MRLYQNNLSPFSSRVRICLYAKDLDVELDDRLPGGSMHSAEFAGISPIERIPVLQVNGSVHIPESQIIVDYLEERYPEPSLLPTTPEARAFARLIPRLIDLYVYPSVTRVFGAMRSKEGGEDFAALGKELGSGLALIDHYVDGGPFCIGDRLTIADAAFAPVMLLVSGPIANILAQDVFKNRPKLAAAWQGCQEHPCVGRVLGEMRTAMSQFKPG